MYKDRLQQLFQKMYPNVSIEKLVENRPIVMLLNLDSLAFVKLIFEIEQQFDSTFSSSDIFDTNLTFSKIIEIMEKEF